MIAYLRKLIIIIFFIDYVTLQNIFDTFRDNFNRVEINDTNDFLKKYDFIIIGSGSGGSVIANRLSEESKWNILLLEVGDEENALSEVPLTAALLYLTRFNWGYKADPQKGACLGLNDGVCNWPKGRALGGTSVINYLLYQRGHKQDFNDWAKLGNTGWSYKDVLPYFIKSEKINIPEFEKSPYHGHNGYVSVQHSPYKTELLDAFIKTGLDMGYSHNDPNADTLLGFSQVQATMRNGRRCSASKAYLQPIINRINLHISMHSWVTKILIDPKTSTAFGVEFTKFKQKYVIYANKEVIVAAGAIASPQLLMLSGIGPKDHLQELNIPVIKDLKVGYNLQDHIGVNGILFTVNKSITIIETEVQNPINILDYVVNSRGPFTMPGGAEGLAFLKTDNSTLSPDYPDVEVVLGAGALSGDISGSMRKMLGVPDDFFNTVYKDIIGKHAFSLVPILMRPKSRGRVKLKSKNPFQWPSMQANYLTESTDLTQLIGGIKLVLKMARSKPFSKFQTKLHQTPFLGCERFKFGSDLYWECCIRRYTATLQHQVGSCKMGPESDPDAVVNPQLQVHGIRNLRVVDASIMPILPAAHTNSIVYMIGEKASDMIKTLWNK